MLCGHGDICLRTVEAPLCYWLSAPAFPRLLLEASVKSGGVCGVCFVSGDCRRMGGHVYCYGLQGLFIIHSLSFWLNLDTNFQLSLLKRYFFCDFYNNYYLYNYNNNYFLSYCVCVGIQFQRHSAMH